MIDNKRISIKNFDDLGVEYQTHLIAEIVSDHKFAETIIDMIKPELFPNEVFNNIIKLIKLHYERNETLPNYADLRILVNVEVPPNNKTFKQQLLDTLDIVQKAPIGNKIVTELADKFCKLQNIKSAIEKIKNKVDKGIVQDFDEIEKVLRNSLDFKSIEDPIELFTDFEKALERDYRNPIPTGIAGVDKVLKGGLAKGELGLIIAPLGTGKTTILTRMSSTAYSMGFNVLQIFFEDQEVEIQRKHMSALTGISINELADNADLVKEKVKLYADRDNKLMLLKLPAEGVSLNKIKTIIKKILSKGQKIDLMVIDYIDCILGDNLLNEKDEWAGEGKIMRRLETMTEEFNVATWTATQGNRSATNIDIVKTENMGGNLKKAQIVHFIMSIARTLEQKEQKVANLAIIKNRIGDDGMVFKNCLFDNSRLLIDTNETLSELGFEKQKSEEKEQAQKERLARIAREIAGQPQN
jgi:replicative DNA helicase